MTDAPVLDGRAHRTAIDAVLTTAVGANRVYSYGTVPGADGNPGTLPDIFVLPSVERRYVEPYHAGRSPRSGWRVTTRFVGRSVAEAQWAEAKIAAAFDGLRLTVDGVVSTPVVHESSQAIEKDTDGRFSGLSIHTYAL